MKKKAVASQGVLVESAPLVARAQACMKRAQAMRQEGDEAGAATLGNALSAAELKASMARR